MADPLLIEGAGDGGRKGKEVDGGGGKKVDEGEKVVPDQEKEKAGREGEGGSRSGGRVEDERDEFEWGPSQAWQIGLRA